MIIMQIIFKIKIQKIKYIKAKVEINSNNIKTQIIYIKYICKKKMYII